MPGDKLNLVYNDITWTKYPSKIDSRLNPPIDIILSGTSTIIVPAADQIYNSDLDLNIDYESYAKAADVNALQDAVIAIQRTIGVKPEEITTNLFTKVNELENLDFDSRYIYQSKPTGWVYTADRDTIYTHKHNGNGISAPSKINLASEVQGKLLKTNLELAYNTTNALTGADISLSPTDSTKIKDAITAQFPITAGADKPITGDLYLNKKFYGSLYGEWEAKDYCTDGTALDSDTYSGTAALLSSASPGWKMSLTTPYTKLRYGKFAVGFRIKCNGTPDEEDATLCRLSVGPAPGEDAANTFKYIYYSDFEEQDTYQMFYVIFDHVPYSGSNAFYFGVYWNGTENFTGSISIDSVIVTPCHTAVYDK